ncbi:MAG TPA: hypothetical protein VEI97_07820, partial [bacterium]|nr:hypothetical protein [bacterium]
MPRGAVQIHFDETKDPFHCPHCGQEFFPDDVLCISCGFEFADEQHPYHTPLRRPAPLLDVDGILPPGAAQAIADRLTALSQELGMEVLLAVLASWRNRPPEETAWFFANAWELGGVSSPREFPIPPPVPQGCLPMAGAMAKEIALLPVNVLKGLAKTIGRVLKPARAPVHHGLAIFVFTDLRTITLEPTIAAEAAFDWSKAAAGLAPLAERLGNEPVEGVVGDLLEALPKWRVHTTRVQ